MTQEMLRGWGSCRDAVPAGESRAQLPFKCTSLDSASVLVNPPWPQHPEPGRWFTLSRTPRLQHLLQLMVLTPGTFQADVLRQAG